MIAGRSIELTQSGLDVELSEAERIELGTYLEQSGEARDYQAKMQELSAFLDRAPELEVPDGLRERILDQVELPAVKARGAGFRLNQLPGFVRYGLATAAGLLLAFGIYEFRPGADGEQGLSDMTGTIMPGGNASGEVVLDSYSFEIEQLSSSVSLQNRDGALVLDVLLDATGPGEITVNFTSDGLQFDAIAPMQSDLSSIVVAGQAIQVKGSGRQHFAVLLHRDDKSAGGAAASIKLEYSGDGKLLKSGKLTTN